MMRKTTISCLLLGLLVLCGCDSDKKKPYGSEMGLSLPGGAKRIWAVAPAIDLSGQKGVDPLLQADMVYKELQEVAGLTVIPVNKVANVYYAMRIERVQSEEQALTVCEQLGCDGLLVPTITAFDPYNPPKFGASLQVFQKLQYGADTAGVNPRELARQSAPTTDPIRGLPTNPRMLQAVGMFDAANGSVRASLDQYAAGRADPNGPYAQREYLVNMERYCQFVYHQLIEELLKSVPPGR